MSLDQEQIRLLALASREPDGQKVVELIEQALARFKDEDDLHQLCQCLPVRMQKGA